MRSSLKALNQSVSSQVGVMMRDPHKLLQRTRLLRSHSKPLGGSGNPAAEQVLRGGWAVGGAWGGWAVGGAWGYNVRACSQHSIF